MTKKTLAIIWLIIALISCSIGVIGVITRNKTKSETAAETRKYKEEILPLVSEAFSDVQQTSDDINIWVESELIEVPCANFNKVKFFSFDYTMSYPISKRPYWLPTRVYDDGSKTCFEMKKNVLHTTSPVLFNQKNERIYYFLDSVDKNLIVIPELIEKVTMQVGEEKVTVQKKSYKEPKNGETQLRPVDIQDECIAMIDIGIYMSGTKNIYFSKDGWSVKEWGDNNGAVLYKISEDGRKLIVLGKKPGTVYLKLLHKDVKFAKNILVIVVDEDTWEYRTRVSTKF